MIVRQDFADAIRPVFFQTETEEFLYATDGGTVFLVRYKGRGYGVTCRHVFTGNGFDPNRVFITQEKRARKGSMPAPVKSVAYASALTGGAVGSDLPDLCVIEFEDDMPANFFSGAYIVDERTVGASQPGHSLLVAGVLKEMTSIVPPDICIGYCALEFRDVGNSTSDPVLHEGRTEFASPAFTNIVGISGSPVFDVTSNVLCGMVIRGGMKSRDATIYYMDAYDILKFLEGVSKGAESAYYTKNVQRPVP